jgi:hypothetical protein
MKHVFIKMIIKTYINHLKVKLSSIYHKNCCYLFLIKSKKSVYVDVQYESNQNTRSKKLIAIFTSFAKHERRI